MNKYLKNLYFICFVSSLFFTSASIAKEKKLEAIAPPYLSKGLNDNHYVLDNYENKLGYGKNEYLILYGNQKTWLFDMNGKELRQWDTEIKRALLLKNCNLLVIDTNQNNSVTEKNYNGDVIWEYESPGIAHHDIELDDQGHMYFYYRKDIPKDFPLSNGCSNDEVITDYLVEIDRNGQTLFEWAFHENYTYMLNLDKCTEERRAWLAQSDYSKKLDWVHPNALNVLKDNKWYRMGYKEFKPGNIIMTLHHFHEVVILDKETKKIVWTYKGDELGLRYPHEAKMIPEGVPGAGNIFVFDNGNNIRNYSRVLEINPINKKVIWSYSKPGEFYNKWAGSQERLKNGDTFISDSMSGRVFIVNKDGEILWQFTRPEVLMSNEQKFIQSLILLIA